ncbi:MAG: hypothetical protein A2836_00200 [Candidatus Taylorbacteria bacterium RIFCSPHIGHO2_01_FULL_45_63]|nr:MAG: hypothetical protein A2836_00200 [Candidatus Taylorbacteria bacterium RIFCSPHIGHO2_01_FULL_45_63]OHA32411.1 MAG: hypothetical protein A3A22_00935 [Candidatus Taylorbacteria bacterium RIFCSPLOWO2_01_FULL_45_34b]
MHIFPHQIPLQKQKAVSVSEEEGMVIAAIKSNILLHHTLSSQSRLTQNFCGGLLWRSDLHGFERTTGEVMKRARELPKLQKLIVGKRIFTRIRKCWWRGDKKDIHVSSALLHLCRQKDCAGNLLSQFNTVLSRAARSSTEKESPFRLPKPKGGSVS